MNNLLNSLTNSRFTYLQQLTASPPEDELLTYQGFRSGQHFALTQKGREAQIELLSSAIPPTGEILLGKSVGDFVYCVSKPTL